MPSSTSSSKSPAIFYTKTLLGVCAVLIVAFEVFSNDLLKHNSETYSRISQQYAEALRVRPAGPGEPTPVLMVGNSLLLYGVDVRRLQELTNGQVRVYPVFLEATGYYDWFYALRRLFREGARPPVVVLGVGVNGFVADSVRQEYAPLMLFNLEDALDVASDLKMDRTATSNLLLAHASVFWDTRGVLRTQILLHAIPGYRDLILLLKPQPGIAPGSEFEVVANARLERLRDLCQSYGARLIFLVPPTPGSAQAVRRMTLVAQNAHVQTLVPIDPDVLSAKYYQSDDLHLNSAGAAIFTSALATFLPQTVDPKGITSPD
jgi:lysophospholipase L1-like esterase